MPVSPLAHLSSPCLERSAVCSLEGITVNMSGEFADIVELNVGGVTYTTALETLTAETDSLLGEMFTGKQAVVKDAKGRYFIDRDGVLFRYILDFLRNQKLMLPENFHEKERLRSEAEYFRLPAMVTCLNTVIASSQVKDLSITNCNEAPVKANSGCILVAYRGTFAFGRDGLADVKFRKLARILVCGRVSLCREAFGETLNESRDPDRGGEDRYTARFFLKHTFLEQAVDMLYDAGFRMIGSCGSGTNSAGEIKPGMDSEESKWNHYNEFIFVRG